MFKVALFCQVIDNFGDAGIAWRLAKLLQKQGYCVDLYINNASVLSHLTGQKNLNLETIVNIEGICVYNDAWQQNQLAYQWHQHTHLINLMACRLPEVFWQSLPTKPIIWLQVDYLGLEAWTLDCHKLGAYITHKHNGFTYYRQMFIPGFMKGLAGLISPSIQYKPNHLLENTEFNFLLFCYPNNTSLQVLQALLDYLPCFFEQQIAYQSFKIYVPTSLWDWLNDFLQKTAIYSKNLPIKWVKLPWLTQTQFDKNLQTMHLAWVRGEDSFVQANCLGINYIWQAYVQTDNAHLDKISGFLSWAHNMPSSQQVLFKGLGGMLNITTEDWQNYMLDVLTNKCLDAHFIRMQDAKIFSINNE